MSSAWDKPWAQLLFDLSIKLVFTLFSTIKIPFLLFAERFILPEDRVRLWKLAGHRNAKFFLRIARIKLDIRTKIPEYDFPVIFVSNHPSMIDGFVYYSILAPDLVPLVAPFKSVPFPYSYWFRKMGAIDVQRDEYDEVHYQEANTKKEALKKIVNTLKHETSNVLIFPEGHYERTAKLHYIHTGAARISIRAHAPIAPVSLIGLEAISPDNLHSRPGTITIRFDGLIFPPKVTPELPFHEAVRKLSKEIEEEVISLLPVRYLPDYLKDYEATLVGAFVDIDQTVYEGYSQQDFVKYLFRKHKINPLIAFKILYWLILEKLHLLEHRTLMKLALSILKGWKVEDISRLAKEFFDENVKDHVQNHMIPMIKDHKSQGHIIVLVTEVIHPLARLFQEYFDAIATLDTVLEEKNGVYTGEVSRLCYREDKAKEVKEFARLFHISLDDSYIYADSHSDIPMLELVQHPTAVNPDSELKKEARSRGWSILK